MPWWQNPSDSDSNYWNAPEFTHDDIAPFPTILHLPRSFVAPTALTVFTGSQEAPTPLCSINLEAKQGAVAGVKGYGWEKLG